MSVLPDDHLLSAQRRDAVEAILRMTDRMLELARSGEWQPLIELEAERKPLIEAFFSHPVEAAEAPAVATFIRRVQELDAQVVTLAEQGRESTAEALRVLTSRQRAADAYGAHHRRR